MEQIAFAPAPQPKSAQTSSSGSKSAAGSSKTDKQDFKTAFDNSLREQSNKPEEKTPQTTDQNESITQKDNSTDSVAAQAESPSEHNDSDELIISDEQISTEQPAGEENTTEQELPAGLAALVERYNITLGNTAEVSDSPTSTTAASENAGSQFARIPQQLLELLIDKNSQKPEAVMGDDSARTATTAQTSTAALTNQDDKIMAMARQLDAIINGYQEKGTASITIERTAEPAAVTVMPASKPAVAITEEMSVQASVGAGTISRSVEGDTNNTLSRVAQMRLEAANQNNVSEAVRVAVQPDQESATQQNSTDNSGTMQSQGSATPLQTGPVATETNVTFAQTLNAQAADITQTTATAKTATQFVHQQVNENEVMQQVVQRFSVNPRLQTSKISMQLHPAELGEIKLDVLVKGDSIKASIVAHNQQVQDIIEKNISRLKTVLEEQGFTVDDIVVSTTNEDGSSFNLFQESFSHQEQQQHKTQKSSSIEFEIPIDEIHTETASEESGVNVKV